MLPSFRLIAATFLCGFVVVFAGLRMAASLNDMHEGLPVMAAHAAPVAAAPIADHDMRRVQSTVPVMYDLRFAVSRAALAPTLVAATPVAPDRPAPPLSLAPPADFIREAPAPIVTEAAPPEPQSIVAAIRPEPPVIEPPAATAPVIVPPAPETPKPEAPAVAAIDPQPAASLESAAAPALEIVANPAPAASIPDAKPAEAKTSEAKTSEAETPEAKTPETKTAAIEPQATPEPDPKPEIATVAAKPPADESDVTASIDPTDNTATEPHRSNPVLAVQQTKPKVGKRAAPKKVVLKKVEPTKAEPTKAAVPVRKKRIARRAAPAGVANASSPFSSPFGSFPQ